VKRIRGSVSVAQKRVDITYDAASQMTGVQRYSDLAGTQSVANTAYIHDAAGRLTALSHSKNSTPIANYGFTYDAANRLAKLITPDGTSDYSYNQRDELTATNHSNQTDESYSYDDTGNRKNAGYVTGDQNRLLSDGTYNYAYDNEGNRTRRVEIATGAITEYGWDTRNRMTSVVTKANGGSVIKAIEYTYDVYDRRIVKSVDGDGSGPTAATEERFVYDGEHIALVFDGAGNQTSRYLHGPQVDQVLAEETAAGEVRWALADHQGSVRDVTGSQGTVLNHLTYDSYGQVTSETHPELDFRFGYTGRERDEETGLYYYRARYFDPAPGTFVSEDPLGFGAGDSNVYRYVSNSPTNYIDPYGTIQLGTVAREAGTTFAVGAVIVGGAVVLGVSAPVVAVPAAFALGFGFGRSYMHRWEEAYTHGVFHQQYRIGATALLDTFGLSGLVEGSFGRSLITGCELSEEDQSERLGRGLGNLATLGFSSTIGPLSRGAGQAVSILDEAISALTAGDLVFAGGGGMGLAAAAEVAAGTGPQVGAGLTGNIANEIGRPLLSSSGGSNGEVSSNEARKQAMRKQGIPTSQQPASSSKNNSGLEYQYEVPKPGGGTEIKSVQQQTLDSSHPGQGHWEAGKVKTDPLTGSARLNQYGRPKLTNSKSKVNYDD
jgi:RHS repeat-associated protein